MDPQPGARSSAPAVSQLLQTTATKNPVDSFPGATGALEGSASGSTGAAAGSSVPDNTTAAPVSQRTRLQKGVTKPVNYKQITKFGLACSIGEPNTLEEALSDARWENAMEEECMALRKNKTWHLVPP